MIEFVDKQTGVCILFTDDVVDILLKFRQDAGKNEAGGMLFCREFFSEKIIISCISQPHENDTRRRLLFKHHKKTAQKIINKMFKEGLHYVGDWHTHPQPTPAPSYQDMRTMMSIFNKSAHNLNYMVHVIIPSVENFGNAYISLTNGHEIYRCFPNSSL